MRYHSQRVILIVLCLCFGRLDSQVIVENVYFGNSCDSDLKVTNLYPVNMCFEKVINQLEISENRFTVKKYYDDECTKLQTSSTINFECKSNYEYQYVEAYQFPENAVVLARWLVDGDCSVSDPVPGTVANLVSASIIGTGTCLQSSDETTIYNTCDNSTRAFSEYIYTSGPAPPAISASASAVSTLSSSSGSGTLSGSGTGLYLPSFQSPSTSGGSSALADSNPQFCSGFFNSVETKQLQSTSCQSNIYFSSFCT